MSILSRSADLVYTFRFLRLLTTDFEDTNAYKLGIIDEKGNRIKSKKITTSEEKSAYNSFHRLVFNIKKLLAKAPGGSSRLASYAAALFLIKEKYNLDDSSVQRIVEKSNVDTLDFINESSSWFLSDDKMLSPGIYRVRNDKLLNVTCEELVKAKDRVRVLEDCYPVGDVLGVDVYEAVHVPTNQKVYVTIGELVK